MDKLFISEQVERSITAVRERGVELELLHNRAEALERIQALIPAGASLMTGGSKTLQEIGFEELLLSEKHPWKNLKTDLLNEKDPSKQARLRQEASLADYFLGSPQAIVETGELVFASAGGSQLPAYAFTSNHIIWVAGIQKIVPNLEAALQRVREYCLPREDERIKSLGMGGSFVGKLMIFEREPALLGRKLHLLLVNETIGV